MAEKVLIEIDDPGRCGRCPLIAGYYKPRCSRTGRGVKKYYDTERPGWCPLIPLPKKQERIEIDPEKGINEASYNRGWNRCIDELEGR